MVASVLRRRLVSDEALEHQELHLVDQPLGALDHIGGAQVSVDRLAVLPRSFNVSWLPIMITWANGPL